MLQHHLIGPLAVDPCELLLGLNAVIVDGEKLALFPSLLQADELGGIWLRCACRRSVRAGIGLGFEGVVLHSQAGGVRTRLLHSLLDQLVTAALVEPRLNTVSQR